MAFVPTSTNGLRIDYLKIQACSNAIAAATAANIVQIWLYDGTNAYLNDEIVVTVVTPSAVLAAYNALYTYAVPLVLPPAFSLYASVTVTTTAATTALQVTAYGGSY